MNEYGIVYENVDLKKYTTLGVGGIAKYLIEVTSEKNLVSLIKYLRENNLKYYILGNGSNVILDDSFFDGVIIRVNKLNKIEVNEDVVTASCGVKLGFLNNVALQNGLVSLYFASLIPGEVGSSVMGNAGCYNHSLMEYVQSVKVLTKEGNVTNISKSEIKYGYRYTSLKGNIILSVTFKLEKGDPLETLKLIKENNDKRLATQPLDTKNVGSIFKNPEGYSAGKLIDDLGLKGYHIGDAYVSDKHANFIVNKGNATYLDVLNLISYIKLNVFENYKISLEVEPKIVSWSNLWKRLKRK